VDDANWHVEVVGKSRYAVLGEAMEKMDLEPWLPAGAAGVAAPAVPGQESS
jgi:hypothetical protein